MMGTLPTLIGLQAYLAHAFKNLGGLGLKTWTPTAFQTDNRTWKSNGRIILPSTEIASVNGSRIENDRLLSDAIANRLRITRGLNSTAQIGALIEEARTNLVLRSEEQDNGVYTKSGTTITADDKTAPNGAVTADKIVETTATGVHLINQGSISYVSGNSYAHSFFVNADERSEFQVDLDFAAFGSNSDAFFNLATGTVGTVGSGIVDAYIVPLPNGWFRCVVVDTATSTVSATVALFLSSGSETTSYTGDSSKGLHSWGWQVELASNGAASSYIKTVATTVTRISDDLQYSNTGEQIFEAAEGTCIIIVTSGSDGADVSIRSEIIETREASQDNGFFLQIEPTSNLYEYTVRSGAADSAFLTSTTVPTRGVTDVIVITWKLNDFRLIINGVLEDSDSLGPVPLALNPNVFMAQRFGNIRMFNGLIGPWLTFSRALTLRQANDVVKTWIQPIYPGRLRMAA